MITAIKTFIIGALVAVSSLFGGHVQAPMNVGSFTPVQTPTQYSVYQYMSGSANTMILKTFDINGVKLAMSNFGSIGYGTIEPNSSSNQEQISFTGITQNANGTATLTGVSRGLAFVSPYAPDSTLAHTHATNALFVISNTSAFYSQFLSKTNDATLTGLITFTQPPIGINPGGSPNASNSVAGISKLSIAAASTTNPIVVGVNNTQSGVAISSTNNVLDKAATSQVGGISYANYIVQASTTGRIDPSFIDSTVATSTMIRGVNYTFPSTQGATSTTLVNDGQGNISWTQPGVFANGTLTLTTSGTSTVTLGFQPRFIRMNWVFVCAGGTHTSCSGSGSWNNGTYAEVYLLNIANSGSAYALNSFHDTTAIASGRVNDTAGNFYSYILPTSTGFQFGLNGSVNPLNVSWEAVK